MVPPKYQPEIVALRTTTQSQMSRTWMRAGQAGMYSTGKGSGAGAGDDDMLDAMMAGMESDFTVPTPTSETTATTSETTSASSEGSVDPEPTFVATPVDLEKRLKALSKSPFLIFFVMELERGTERGIKRKRVYVEILTIIILRKPPSLNSARIHVDGRSVGTKAKVGIEEQPILELLDDCSAFGRRIAFGTQHFALERGLDALCLWCP